MSGIWAIEACPFIQYDGMNSAEVASWLEGLDLRYWGWETPTVTITSEVGGVLELHGLSGDGIMSGVEFHATMNTSDWIQNGGGVVPDSVFAERYIAQPS